MGHIAHLKNQFKINTFSLRYDYIKTLIFKFCQWIFAISLLSPLGKGHGPSFKKTWIPFTQWYFVLWLVEIGPVVLEKILNFFKVFLLFHNYIPLKKGQGTLFVQTRIPFTEDTLCQVWLKLVQWLFLNFINVFLLFRNYLPLDKGMALHLNKFESTSSKDTLYQVWLNLALWFLRRRWKCEEFTDRQTSNRCLSFQLRWAKNMANDANLVNMTKQKQSTSMSRI